MNPMRRRVLRAALALAFTCCVLSPRLAVASEAHAKCNTIPYQFWASQELDQLYGTPMGDLWSLSDVVNANQPEWNYSVQGDSDSGSVVTCYYAASFRKSPTVFVVVEFFMEGHGEPRRVSVTPMQQE